MTQTGKSNDSPPRRATAGWVLLLFWLLVETLPVLGAAVNDAFAGRTVLTGSNAFGGTIFTGATREEGEPFSVGSSLWWQWTAPYSRGVAVEFRNLNSAPAALIFKGNELEFANLERISQPAPLLSPGPNPSIYGFSKVSFRAVEGETYFIAAYGDTNQVLGTIQLKPGPANDDFASALQLTGTHTSSSINLHGATSEVDEPTFSTNSSGATLWWKWRPSADVRVRISAFQTDTTVDLGLYQGESLETLRLIDTGKPDVQGRFSMVREVNESDSYYLRVNDGHQILGTGILRIEPLPRNDLFADRLSLHGATLTNELNLVGGTREEWESHPFGQSIWFEWTAPADGGFAFETTSGTLTVTPLVFTMDPTGNLQRVSFPPAAEDFPPWSFTSSSIRATKGTTYYVALAADNLAGRVTFKILPAASNDDFELATGVTNFLSFTAHLRGTTIQPGEPLLRTTQTGRSLWWKIKPGSTSSYGFSLSSQSAAADLALYRGDSFTNLTLLSFDLQQTGLSTSFNAVLNEDEHYYIQLLDQQLYGDICLLRIVPAADNDNFDRAQVITNNFTTGSTVGATSEPNEQNWNSGNGYSVWFKWTAESSSGHEISLQNSFPENHPLLLQVLRGSALSNLELVLSMETTYGAPSVAAFRPAKGETYFFRLDTRNESGASARIMIKQAAINDSFASAQPIIVANSVSLTTSGAGREVGEPLHGRSPGAATLWYEFVPENTGGYYVGSLSAEEPLSLLVYQGTSLTNLTEISTVRAPRSEGRYSNAFHATAGEKYFIVYVDEITPRTTSFTLNASPPNDDFERALDLPAHAISTPAYGATRQPGEPDWNLIGNSGTIWFRWIAPRTATFGAMVRSAGVIAFRGGSIATLVEIDRSLNGLHNPGIPSTVTFHASEGEVIHFASANYLGGLVTIQTEAGPLNDSFRDAIELTLDEYKDVPRYIATREPDEPLHWDSSFHQNSLWWSFVPSANGSFRVEADLVAIYTGNAISDLVRIPSYGRDFYGYAGVRYWIAQGSSIEGMGPVGIAVNRIDGPDHFSNAVVIQTGQHRTNSFQGATIEPGEPLWANPEGGTMWFKWLAETNGTFTFRFDPGSGGAQLAVFEGVTLANLKLVSAITNWISGTADLAFRSVAGTTYHLAAAIDPRSYLWSYRSAILTGNPYDNIADAQVLHGTSVTWVADTHGTTREAGEPNTTNNSATVWARWKAPATSISRVTPAHSGMHVYYKDAQGFPVETGYRSGVQSIDFEATVGTDYFLQFVTENNLLQYSARIGVVPLNDARTNASPLIGLEGVVISDTWVAHREGFDTSSGVWHKFKAPEDGIMVFKHEGSLQIFHGQKPTLNSTCLETPLRPSEGKTFTNQIVVARGVDYFIEHGGIQAAELSLAYSSIEIPSLAEHWTNALPQVFRSGNVAWQSTTLLPKSGPDALSATVATNQSAYLEAVYSGPGTLKFWARSTIPGASSRFMVSAEEGHFPPFPFNDNNALYIISTNWLPYTMTLTKKTNVVRWAINGLHDRRSPGAIQSAAIDEVSFTPLPPRSPRFTSSVFNPETHQFSTSFLAEAARTYSLEYSTNLINWFPLTNFFNPSLHLRRDAWPVDTHNPVFIIRGSVR